MSGEEGNPARQFSAAWQAATAAVDEWRQRVASATAEALDKLDPAVRAAMQAGRDVLVGDWRRCRCPCGTAHPDDTGVCDGKAVLVRRLGEADVSLCAPCAVAQGVAEMRRLATGGTFGEVEADLPSLRTGRVGGCRQATRRPSAEQGPGELVPGIEQLIEGGVHVYVPDRQRPTRGIRARARRILGGIHRRPAEQLLKEGCGDPFGLSDHSRGLGQVEHEVTPVELHQPAPRVRVRDGKLSRMIDPARALGQCGLEQVGAVGGEISPIPPRSGR
jgi:hypothetical protein